MRAVVLERAGGPEVLEYRDVVDPVPGPEDVLVRVHACGVCGRDLIDRRGGFPALKLPAILGHEFAGEVVARGERADQFAIGERVANLHRPFCGSCRACVAGELTDCDRAWQSFGQTVDGAYADFVVANQRALVRVPDDIDLVAACSVGCTAGVALRALRSVAHLELGETVLITGASGGVGMQAIQIARRMGARVVALTSSLEEKRQALLDAGADMIVEVGDGNFHRRVREHVSSGVDVALELTGSPTFPSALRSLRAGGRMVVVGNIQTEKVSFNPGALILFSHHISGSHGYTPEDLAHCFELMRRGDLKPSIDRTLPLEQAAEAHRLMAARRAIGRLILVPSGLSADSPTT